jgi:hypothetical protein
MKSTIYAFAIVAVLAIAMVARAQHRHDTDSAAAPQHDMGETMAAMSGHDHHAMGPHMYLTTLRSTNEADEQRAEETVEAARKALERWKDYRVAEADGYRIFMPGIKQKMYHFTNWKYAMEAGVRFNPEHPTSLLYEKQGDGYKLIGAMYTAPARFSEEQINERIPLSVAQWHKHVNLCRPPAGKRGELLGKNARFGLLGSISTREECEAAGGTFYPQVFGWMVHVYPYETTQDAIWSVERQRNTVEMMH